MLSLVAHNLWTPILASLFAGLSKRTTTDGLKEAFAKFGEVIHGMFA
jgi:uncharacterized membrane protein